MDFTNPVLNADWPDPDVVRVGDDFYLVVSSFNRAPGLPVLHSRDLVTWEVVARALPALPPEAHYPSAPARRRRVGAERPPPRRRRPHHLPDPDHGIFVLSAEDPRGPWSPPRLLLGGAGLIDPCPLWEADGRAYLAHGWARSRSGLANRLTMVGVDPGLTGLAGRPCTVIDGDELPGYHTLGAHVVCRRSVGRRQEHTLAQETLPAREVEVRATCDAEGTVAFAWRVPGTAAWRAVGARFPTTAGRWVGADIGLFAAAPLGAPSSQEHVTFGPVSVDLVGVEEVAA